MTWTVKVVLCTWILTDRHLYSECASPVDRLMGTAGTSKSTLYRHRHGRPVSITFSTLNLLTLEGVPGRCNTAREEYKNEAISTAMSIINPSFLQSTAQNNLHHTKPVFIFLAFFTHQPCIDQHKSFFSQHLQHSPRHCPKTRRAVGISKVSAHSTTTPRRILSIVTVCTVSDSPAAEAPMLPIHPRTLTLTGTTESKGKQDLAKNGENKIYQAAISDVSKALGPYYCKYSDLDLKHDPDQW